MWLKSLGIFILILFVAYIIALAVASLILWDNLFVLSLKEMPIVGRGLLILFSISVAIRIIVEFFPPWSKPKK